MYRDASVVSRRCRAVSSRRNLRRCQLGTQRQPRCDGLHIASWGDGVSDGGAF